MTETIITYGVFDAEGAPKGFYNTDIYPPQEDGSRNAKIPAAAVEITKETWEALLANPWARYENGEVVQYDPPPVPPGTPSPSLVEAQRANARLDAGITAGEDVVREAMVGLRQMPATSTPPTVEELQAQIAYLADQTLVLAQSYAAMITAQADTPP